MSLHLVVHSATSTLSHGLTTLWVGLRAILMAIATFIGGVLKFLWDGIDLLTWIPTSKKELQVWLAIFGVLAFAIAVVFVI